MPHAKPSAFSIQSALTGIPQPNTLSTDSSCPIFSPRLTEILKIVLSYSIPPRRIPLSSLL